MDSRDPEILGGKAAGVLAGALALVLVAVVVRCAWVSDDAYISFRTVDNLVNGYGLTWNVGERVQAFTNPLWVLLLSAAYAATGEIYFTSIALSVLLTAAAALVLVRLIGGSGRGAALALLVLIGSKAFVDYSTSGLENPLTHLLLVAFLAVYLRREASPRTLLALCLVAALGAVNRLDTLLLFLPTILAVLARVPWRKGVPLALIGFAPLVAWELFSLVYYGFPFPNTYYSKLHAGLAGSEMIGQGFLYYIDSLDLDPMTLCAVGAAALAVIAGRASALYGPLSGAGLYLVYVLWIGGDFMSGRFLAAPLLVAACVLSRIELPARGLRLAAPFAAAAALALAPARSPLRSDSSYTAPARIGFDDSGVTDERGYYYQQTGLARAARGKQMPAHPWFAQGLRLRAQGIEVEQRGAIGFAGFAAGPGVRIVDPYGLGDPLIARLRVDQRGEKRIGHFQRSIPAGYLQTVESGSNRIADPSLREYYDALREIVSGPIWSGERFSRIAAMNTGRYDHLVDAYLAELPGRPTVRYDAVSAAKPRGTPWNARGNYVLREEGVEIELPQPSRCGEIELSVDHNDDYELQFLRGADMSALLEVPRQTTRQGGLRVDRIAVPAAAASAGYDAIAVRPTAGDGRYSVGHVRLLCAQ
jgi:arabinofuranosyltransferase